MNAFMVWAQVQRRRISAADPQMHNAEISKRLGAEWRGLSPEDKLQAMEEADRLRLLHLQEYPDYKYKPQKKVRGGAATPTSGVKVKQMKAGGNKDYTMTTHTIIKQEKVSNIHLGDKLGELDYLRPLGDLLGIITSS